MHAVKTFQGHLIVPRGVKLLADWHVHLSWRLPAAHAHLHHCHYILPPAFIQPAVQRVGFMSRMADCLQILQAQKLRHGDKRALLSLCDPAMVQADMLRAIHRDIAAAGVARAELNMLLSGLVAGLTSQLQQACEG